jgi:Cryptococcal mannosyltransferase 1
MPWLWLVLPCLLLASASRGAQQPPLYVAANFHNNAATISGFVTEITELAHRYGPSSLFVTVYESDSTDRTPHLLQDARSQFIAAGIKQ